MNNIFPDGGLLNRFKKRINYPAIVQHIKDNERVVMEWPRVLKKINISNASAWVSYNLNSNIQGKNYAEISDFFENRKKRIRIEIHVFTDFSNQAVIEEAVFLTSYTSMSDIKYEYSKNGPGDFYLYNAHFIEGAGDRTTVCVFKNIIIKISTEEGDTDVRSVAKFLVDLMSTALVGKNQVPELNYKKLHSSRELKVSDTFWVDIEFPSTEDQNNYSIKFDRDSLPDNLEYIKNDESKYYLKASQSGTYQFEMWVMDKRTLITNTASFEVIVKD